MSQDEKTTAPLGEESGKSLKTFEVDLVPSPNVLSALSFTSLSVQDALSELIDNSIDSFTQAVNAGEPIKNPLVSVTIPFRREWESGLAIVVRDNGPGMTPEQAEKVGFLNLKVENKIKAVYLNSNLTNEQKKEFVEGNKKDRMGALKAILTAEQFTLYQTKITEAKASQLK